MWISIKYALFLCTAGKARIPVSILNDGAYLVNSRQSVMATFRTRLLPHYYSFECGIRSTTPDCRKSYARLITDTNAASRFPPLRYGPLDRYGLTQWLLLSMAVSGWLTVCGRVALGFASRML